MQPNIAQRERERCYSYGQWSLSYVAYRPRSWHCCLLSCHCGQGGKFEIRKLRYVSQSNTYTHKIHWGILFWDAFLLDFFKYWRYRKTLLCESVLVRYKIILYVFQFCKILYIINHISFTDFHITHSFLKLNSDRKSIQKLKTFFQQLSLYKLMYRYIFLQLALWI